MRESIGILAAILLVTATVGADTSKTPRHLPKCAEMPEEPQTDFTRVNMDGGFSLGLPSGCVVLQQGVMHYVHGGIRWKCGTVTADLAWGMWGLSSFGEDLTQCRTKVASLPVVVMRSKDSNSVIVWYLTGYTHEPAISAWGSGAADSFVVERIAYSGLLAGKRGPNR